MHVVFHLCNALMVLLFAFAAAVQLNDPDPLLWIALYGVATIATAMAWWRRTPLILFHAVSALCAVAVIPTILLGELGNPMPYFEDSGLLREEMVRELLGLGIIVAWMQVLAVRARHLRDQDGDT